MKLSANARKGIYAAVIAVMVVAFGLKLVKPEEVTVWVSSAVAIAGLAAPILALFHITPDDAPKE